MARLLPPERDIGVLQAPVRSCLALTGIFLIVLLSVGLLERIGIEHGAAVTAVVGAAFALFALAALMSHSRRAADFYVADRKISGAFGGLAGAGSFAGLIVIGLAGGSHGSVAEFLVAAGGFGAGYLILAAIVAPGLRSSGAYTPGDFLAARFGGVSVRLVWAVVAFSVSSLLLIAHLKIAGPLLATLLRITPEHALYVAAGLTAMAALPGGMRSLTWTQAIQYFVIALACLVPAGILALREPGVDGAIAQDFGAMVFDNLPGWSSALTAESALPALLAALGAASLPHLLGRALAAVSGREAGTTMVWSILFSVLLTAAGIILGGLLTGTAGTEFSGDGQALLDALMAALPAVLAGLVLAGVLAALFALGQAALFSAATALSHDLFDEIVDRKGPEGRRIVVARIIVIGVAAGAVALVPLWQVDAPALLQWALALAAAGTFAPLVLGLWWRRCNEIGAAGGMAAGFGFTALVFLMQMRVMPADMVSSGWADVGAPAAAIVGLLIAAVIAIGLSFVTPAPEARTRNTATGTGDRRGPPIRERPA